MTPRLLDRKFKSSAANFEGSVRGREKISAKELDYRRDKVSWANFRANRVKELAALEEMQRNRPLKPPGRR